MGPEPCLAAMAEGAGGGPPCGASSDGRAAHLAKLRAEVEALRMKEARHWKKPRASGPGLLVGGIAKVSILT